MHSDKSSATDFLRNALRKDRNKDKPKQRFVTPAPYFPETETEENNNLNNDNISDNDDKEDNMELYNNTDESEKSEIKKKKKDKSENYLDKESKNKTAQKFVEICVTEEQTVAKFKQYKNQLRKLKSDKEKLSKKVLKLIGDTGVNTINFDNGCLIRVVNKKNGPTLRVYKGYEK